MALQEMCARLRVWIIVEVVQGEGRLTAMAASSARDPEYEGVLVTV